MLLPMPADAAPEALSQRFLEALHQVQDKLVHLIAFSPLLLIAVLIVWLSIWLGGVASRRLHFLTPLGRRNPYMVGMLRNTVRIVIGVVGLLIALDLLNATPLVGAVLGSAGLVGLVLGFAFKDIAENYIAGVLLSLRQPFRPGDKVRVDTHEGKVVSLTSRATILMTDDGNHLQLPNSMVFKSVLLNFTRNPKLKLWFPVGVGARAPLHDAMEAGLAALRGVEGVLADPPVNVAILSLQTDQVTLQFEAWIDQTRNDAGKTRSEALRRVRAALWDAGIPPPQLVRRVVLSRTPIDDAPPSDPGECRDTSVDRTLDAQLHEAQREERGRNLLVEDGEAETAAKNP